MEQKIVAVIQARMGSTRLPGKVLKNILGRPMLWHIVRRVKEVRSIDDVVVATSIKPGDDAIERFCEKENIACFRGSENDVLDRFYKAALNAGATTVLRITGDCPLIDPGLISRLITFFGRNNLDYCGVATGAGVAMDGFCGRYPDGLDTEIFLFSALKKAWNEAVGDMYREHVTPYLWKNPGVFKTASLKSPDRDYSDLRWTLDNEEDYEVIKAIYETLYPGNPSFNMHDILELIQKQPQVCSANRHFIGREGYEKFWNEFADA